MSVDENHVKTTCPTERAHTDVEPGGPALWPDSQARDVVLDEFPQQLDDRSVPNFET